MNIYDIAQKSGVSIATISRVLNGGKNVSQKTYDRVMKVIEEEGYTPNVFARGLGLNTMQTIGILVTDLSDPYYAEMINHLSEHLHALGMNVLLSCTGHELKNKKKELNMLLNKRVDAIFLAGSSQQELTGNAHIKAAAEKVPVIMVNGFINAPGIINVASNDKQAICDAVKLLHREGFTRPLYIYNHLSYSGSQKISGYDKAFRELNYPAAQRSIVQVSGKLAALTQALLQLIDSGQVFDSLIASEDLLAIAAVKAMRERGRKVPVIGYNNSVLAVVSSPTITSIDCMLEPLCKMAVQLFDDLSKGEELSSRLIIDTRLVERETFSPVR